MVMWDTKAVLLLLQGECGSGVRQCQGQVVGRFVCHGCSGIATHLSQLRAGLTHPKWIVDSSGLEPDARQGRGAKHCF